MSDLNGKRVFDQAEILKFLAEDQGIRGKYLALEWKEDLPHLRNFLIGAEEGTQEEIGSSLLIQRVPAGLRLKLHSEVAGTQLEEYCKQLSEGLEILNNHIALKTGNWLPDWKELKQQRRELDRRRGGS